MSNLVPVPARDWLGLWLALVALAVVLAFRVQAHGAGIALFCLSSLALVAATRQPRQGRPRRRPTAAP
jgi:hypothetical protein